MLLEMLRIHAGSRIINAVAHTETQLIGLYRAGIEIPQLCLDAAHDANQLSGIEAAAHNHTEFIPAIPRNNILQPHRAAQDIRRIAQRIITGIMAISIVDLLKGINIDGSL